MNKKQIQETLCSEPPDEFTMLGAMVTKTGNVEGTGTLHSVTVRFPTIEFCTVEALAKHSGQSRNKIIVQMVKACIERLNDELPPDDLKEIGNIREALLAEYMRGGLPFETGSL